MSIIVSESNVKSNKATHILHLSALLFSVRRHISEYTIVIAVVNI